MTIHTATPGTLAALLAAVQPGDTVQLGEGAYVGAFVLKVPNVTLVPAGNVAATFVGPDSLQKGVKKPWLHIQPGADNANVFGLSFIRDGDIAQRAAYKDLGIVTEADGVTIDYCAFRGMNIGVHVKGTSLRSTITHCHFGPTYQSNVAISSSNEVIRGLLLAWNVFEKSYIEDGIQWMPRQTGDTWSPEHIADISNYGTIVFQCEFRDCGENAMDLKGAAYVVIDGNTITRTCGSVDGPVDGWNHNSPASIMRGANASSEKVIVRNNLITDNSSGVRVYAGYHVFHNTILDNNYSPEDTGPYDGFGISQIEKPSAIKNNWVSGNRRYNVQTLVSTDVVANQIVSGSGVALTRTRGPASDGPIGSGRILPLEDAGYFTDWFGRDLPPDVLYLAGVRCEVQAVDYAANTVTLDHDVTWQAGEPVFWRSPEPTVGIQEPYTPPPVEPPDELVKLILEASMSPADAAQLRALLAGKNYTVSLG
jgi:hypothetical protein